MPGGLGLAISGSFMGRPSATVSDVGEESKSQPVGGSFAEPASAN